MSRIFTESNIGVVIVGGLVAAAVVLSIVFIRRSSGQGNADSEKSKWNVIFRVRDEALNGIAADTKQILESCSLN